MRLKPSPPDGPAVNFLSPVLSPLKLLFGLSSALNEPVDDLLRDEKGFLSPVLSPPKLLFGLSSELNPLVELPRDINGFLSPALKLLAGLGSLSAVLPVYGLPFGANALFSPDDSPSVGLPLYGLLLPVNGFLSLLLKLLAGLS